MKREVRQQRRLSRFSKSITACAEAFALAQEMRNVELTGLDESATRVLANAKERFKDARREATRAFKNEALTTPDRILAMEYRVMATILETIDNRKPVRYGNEFQGTVHYSRECQ